MLSSDILSIKYIWINATIPQNMGENIDKICTHQTFTCPYGTFAYCRMPFGLYNTPVMFQRCMIVIFLDMLEEGMELFMDDFLIFSSSFDHCLTNLEKTLKRCI